MWVINQPVVIYCPSKHHYIKVIFKNDDLYECHEMPSFHPDCILSLEEAIDPLNALIGSDVTSNGYQILKVVKIESNYFIQHEKNK